MDNDTTLPAPLSQPAVPAPDRGAERGNARYLLLFALALLLVAAAVYLI